MHKTIIKSNSPVSGVRQLIRQNTFTGKFENPIDEMDIAMPDKGHIAELWLKVKEQMKVNIDIEKEKSHIEGKQESLEDAKNEVAHEVDAIQSIVNAFADNTINAVNNFEKSLVKLSIKIAEKIIKRKIEDQDDVVMSVVRSALETVKESSEITLFLNPSDFEIITKYQKNNLFENKKINFTIDEGIESGGCKIHSDWGVIDSQIDTQLQEIYTQLIMKTEDEPSADSIHVSG